jgi:hypothetical protein
MIAHWACLHPDENGNRPDSRHPPATRCAVARGVSEDDATASGVSPHTSICACSGIQAMIHWCSPSTAKTQADAAHPSASVSTIRENVSKLA